MMHGFQQIVTQAERRYNFVVHGLPPLRDEMAVSPLIWRKRPMDSISSNLGLLYGPYQGPTRAAYSPDALSGTWLCAHARAVGQTARPAAWGHEPAFLAPALPHGPQCFWF